MITTIIVAIVCLLIGWATPQPTWATDVTTRIKAWFASHTAHK